jgi:cytoskeletal protein CcmA (bactofilin family)
MWGLMKRCGLVLGVLMMFVWLGQPAMAAAPWEIHGGDTEIDSERVIAGDLIFSGDKLTIAGTVNGDLIVFARQVTVSGRVKGSVLGIVTESLTINGTVDGNVRTATNRMTLTGQVGQTLSAYVISLNTGRNSRVGGGILITCNKLRLTGTVAGPVEATANSRLLIGGDIDGNVTVKGAPLQWLAPVRISGRVDDYSGTTAKIQSNQKVDIKQGYHAHRVRTDLPFYNKMLFMISLIWFLGNLLMSLIFYRIFPRTAWRVTQPSVTMLQRSLLTGLLTLIIVPVVIFLLLFTIVGLPIAAVLFFLYLVLLLFANVPVSLLLGRVILRQYGPGYPTRPGLLIMIGCLFVSLFTAVPWIGMILPAGLGAGMLIRQIRPEYNQIQAESQKP